ncbi:MAG: hypothetical protein M0C28_13100 [Candidatus Moduliflexus flocculans]|nr:hypothetical protein [Candidatus Moduliflexus flocculans]
MNDGGLPPGLVVEAAVGPEGRVAERPGWRRTGPQRGRPLPDLGRRPFGSRSAASAG